MKRHFENWENDRENITYNINSNQYYWVNSFYFLSSNIMNLLSRKWFFFIEWCGLVAVWVIGILSAALFPSMTSYLQRSRDAARMSHIKDLSNSIGAYYSDTETYPEPEGWCFPVSKMNKYLYNWTIPNDPTPWKLSWYCDGENGTTYGYGKYKNTAGFEGFYLIAEMERSTSGNSDMLPDEITDEKSFGELRKGAGKYYILYK